MHQLCKGVPTDIKFRREELNDTWQDFVVTGTASEKLFGMAESLWEPDLAPEDLFETISQALLNGVDRDAYSGWGAMVWVVEKVREHVQKNRLSHRKLTCGNRTR